MAILKELRSLRWLSAVLALVGLLDSLYLWWTKLSHSEIICGVGECDVVNSSPYAALFGIPVAALGALGYGALLALALWVLISPDTTPYWLTDLRLFFGAIGLLFAAYLTAIEVFVIHAI
jgi:uncharacterized membrane protein